MNDLSKSLKILVDRYPGTMAELARQAQIDRSSLYKIMDGKRMPNRAQLQRLIHALGLSARQAEHLTTQYDELRSGAQAHRTDEALYELLYFISLEIKLSRNWHTVSIHNAKSHNVGHFCKSGQYASSVGVSKSPLYVVLFVEI